MPEKRKRRATPLAKGLAAGEKLKRDLFSSWDYSTWGWVGTDVKDATEITQEHRLATCRLGKKASDLFCPNKYLSTCQRTPENTPRAEGELDDDSIIVISDGDEHTCTKKGCRDNPNCLNHLGQEKWEDEKHAREAYFKASILGESPDVNRRDPILPVGLKNLGATCYANAFLQVWFQDLAFRAGVYQCQPSFDNQQGFEDSPIFQLQVTFAALQQSTQAVFNPVKLVESLQLRTSEQQDAQEFSKLFMSHLDSEFKKQTNPILKSLLSSQFEGKLVYATVCENCKIRSERESDFLELEVNLESNAKLEDRISALLAPETLTDDNRYLCSHCESLENATRYTELRQLPPVLHISLLRFVYDIATLERKKSKHVILFPPYLDMAAFLRVTNAKNTTMNPDVQYRNNEHLYELRGVLLHKGLSAYHGHYEAQAFDVTAKQWYQFNDETVSVLGSFHNPKSSTSMESGGENEEKLTERPKRPKKAKQKRRIDDSDEEIDRPSDLSNHIKNLRSKDAYMLIYARRDCPSAISDKSEQSTLPGSSKLPSVSTSFLTSSVDCPPSEISERSQIPVPPRRALEVVKLQNEAFEAQCHKYAEREKAVQAKFDNTRRIVLDIYRSWSVSSAADESLIVSRTALEKWLDQCFSSDLNADEKSKSKQSNSDNDSIDDEFPESIFSTSISPLHSTHSIDNSQVRCLHGHLNPLKGREMKRISAVAYGKIVKDSGYRFYPEFTSDDVCKECVEKEFVERLYQIEHPRLVAKFDEVCDPASEYEGYWMSKAWLKDWRLAKPKMHIRLRCDPAPDDAEFCRHVKCEHGGLSLNSTTRRRVTNEAVEILKVLYPSWLPLPWDAELCAICDALVHVSKEDKLEMRKRAETEKALLRRVYENDIFGRRAVLTDTPCALVKSTFIRAWRSWLLRPGDNPRPGTLDNSHLVCVHQKLNFDPSTSVDLDDDLAVVSKNEWETLEDLYSACPLIAIHTDADGTTTPNEIVADLPTCAECRQKRLLDFQTTCLTVIILKPEDPVPTDVSAAPLKNGDDKIVGREPVLATNGSADTMNGLKPLVVKQSNPTRQSKRIRDGKGRGQRRQIRVNKNTNVREMKILLQKELDISTISQRLFHCSRELDNSALTVADLEILDKDTLYLKEVDEDEALLDSDADITRLTKKRKEGRAFHGTLLDSSSREQVSNFSTDELNIVQQPEDVVAMIHCPACTFANPADCSSCTMCDTPFI